MTTRTTKLTFDKNDVVAVLTKARKPRSVGDLVYDLAHHLGAPGSEIHSVKDAERFVSRPSVVACLWEMTDAGVLESRTGREWGPFYDSRPGATYYDLRSKVRERAGAADQEAARMREGAMRAQAHEAAVKAVVAAHQAEYQAQFDTALRELRESIPGHIPA